MPQWSEWAEQTFRELAKELKRPVDEVSFCRVEGDRVEAVVHSRGTTKKYLFDYALFTEDTNRRYELKKQLKRIVRTIPATPSRQGERKGSASPSPLPPECRQMP
jgi:hypothetical protein